jgi:hypothetical protein
MFFAASLAAAGPVAVKNSLTEKAWPREPYDSHFISNIPYPV